MRQRIIKGSAETFTLQDLVKMASSAKVPLNEVYISGVEADLPGYYSQPGLDVWHNDETKKPSS